MGNAKKAAAKIADPDRIGNVTVAEVETALRAAGFVRDGGRGSHLVWRHSDGRKAVVPCHGSRLPPYIVRQVRSLLLS